MIPFKEIVTRLESENTYTSYLSCVKNFINHTNRFFDH